MNPVEFNGNPIESNINAIQNSSGKRRRIIAWSSGDMADGLIIFALILQRQPAEPPGHAPARKGLGKTKVKPPTPNPASRPARMMLSETNIILFGRQEGAPPRGGAAR
jgi:hypothetical protein